MTTPIASTGTVSAASTFCVGRFLIDVPAGSKVSGGNFKYDFLRIEPVQPVSKTKFGESLDAEEAKLKAAKHSVEPSLLRLAQRPANDTRILAYWENEYATGLVKIDGYRYSGNTFFRLKGDADANKQDLGLKRMQEALVRLRPRADTDIPKEPGFCFAGGFIENPRWRNEHAQVDIDIAGHPDAFVSVWVYSLGSHKQDKPLLERVGGMSQALGNLASTVNVLRKGNRQIGPYKGQEILVSAPNSGGMRGHAFVWEMQGQGTLDEPAIKIEFTTGHQDSKGNPQKTAFTDQQAMKLWDDILRSLRLRLRVLNR